MTTLILVAIGIAAGLIGGWICCRKFGAKVSSVEAAVKS